MNNVKWNVTAHRTVVTELLGVIANPFETVKQLNESRQLLAQAKEVGMIDSIAYG